MPAMFKIILITKTIIRWKSHLLMYKVKKLHLTSVSNSKPKYVSITDLFLAEADSFISKWRFRTPINSIQHSFASCCWNPPCSPRSANLAKKKLVLRIELCTTILSAYLGNTLCNNWTKTRGGIVDPLSIVLNKSLSAAVRALSSFPKPPSFIFQNSFT